MDRGAWRATVYRVAKSLTQLSNFTHTLEEEASLKKRERESLAVIGFPGGSDGKEFVCNAGDPGLIPELGRSPREGNGNHSSILAWKIPWTGESGRL